MDNPKIITRDFVLAFLSQFVFSFAFSMLIPTLPIYLSRLGSREEEIGILIGVLSFSSVVLRPSVGRLLSRVPEKRFMIAGSLLCAMTSVGYLLTSPFWPFLIVRLLQGIGFGFFFAASNTLIANISPETRRAQSISYFYLSLSIPLALAPALGMFLINQFSFTLLFWASTGLYLLSVIFLAGLRKRQVSPLMDPLSRPTSFIHRETLPPSIIAFFVSIIWGTVTTFFPLFALGHGVTNPGFVFSVLAIMLILTRTLGSRILDLYRREHVILPCLVIYTMSMVLLVFSKTLPMFIVVAIVWGAGHALLYPTLVAMVIDRAGSSRGLALAIFTAASDLGMGLGPVIMGIVLHWTSYPIMFLCVVFTGIINISYFLTFVRRKEAAVKPPDGG
ncbi:MAG: MFS transporter [Deltaproteobacteria bacterium]